MPGSTTSSPAPAQSSCRSRSSRRRSAARPPGWRRSSRRPSGATVGKTRRAGHASSASRGTRTPPRWIRPTPPRAATSPPRQARSGATATPSSARAGARAATSATGRCSRTARRRPAFHARRSSTRSPPGATTTRCRRRSRHAWKSGSSACRSSWSTASASGGTIASSSCSTSSAARPPEAMAFTIRSARRADGRALVSLVRGLAEFERLPPPDDEAAARLVEHAFGPRPRFDVLVAVDGHVRAYGLFFDTYSTFLAAPSLWLEDLFVDPAVRGRGVGTALMREIAGIAVARGCHRFEWTVLDWNERAQAFYRALGARMLREWQVCRLEDEALA